MESLHLARVVKLLARGKTEEWKMSYLELDFDRNPCYRIFPFDFERHGALYHDGILVLDLTGNRPILKEE